MRKIIDTPLAPRHVAPLSQAVRVDNTVYVSGVVGVDKDSMKLVEGGAIAEARQALNILGHILQAAGSSYTNVVKVTVFLGDISDYSGVNDIYKEYFRQPYPARSMFQVGKLPLGAKVEIEAIAVVGEVNTVGGLGTKSKL